MKLIDDFYTIIDSEMTTDGLRCSVAFHSKHVIFAAHFPDNPVTPGMCLVTMATEMLEQAYDCRLSLNQIVSIKFKQPLPPTKKPTFVISKVSSEDNRLRAQVRIEDEQMLYVQMSLRFTVTPHNLTTS